ncbi:type I polyketide synthase [Anabaena lutea]|uniref:SDR family NAD(P)-dependent oxidoreductase n=1 Tax=Anabaena lutea FACHB-196 TaxID=2692881 RepID=A0ABR8FES9_9NOST|nr:type I polyketide synthase [Anabaena lutea]MBD2567370.1 SDR family NAD(P)-dependent oxidoreductase [Anabaena lutea FACHB-196]
MGNTNIDESMEGIAIIGISGRFPGANNIEEFWHNLQAGVESISRLTDEELLSAGVSPSCLDDSNYVKAGGVLEDIDLFDAAFFDLNPKEAEITDPQHRLFLECAWEALETAGYDSNRCESRIGVYAGASLNNYLSFDLNSDQFGSAQSYQKLIGNDKDFLSTRVSYKLNLTGPSLTVQTACSTSLVAISLACQSLINYQCDMALAGGVSIRVPHKTGYLYQPGGTLSPDGHCRAFDAQAQGITVGNGVGVVLLKRLEDAIADGDHIYAVVKGWAINNDGSMKVGYTAPSVDGQAEAIAEAIMLAGVKPETISYIEAHGTGTTLGDPIEIAALSKVFRSSTDKKGFCAIGSVKTNIGHLDAAAGVTGVIKTALALKHQQIPPSLNFTEPNPQIDFDNSPFYVNTKLTQWKPELSPRRAGVSSLGIGGTNAHVVLEEAPIIEQGCKGAGVQGKKHKLLVLSAKTESALDTATDNLAQHLKQHPELDLADVAYTLQVGRKEFNHRRVLVCEDIEDAINTLENRTSQRVFTADQESCDRPITFMFPGQGSQYVNMGKELYQTESIFRESVDRCCLILKPLLDLDLHTVIYPSEADTETAQEKLKQTSLTQPALFVIEYALARMWMSWGISPSAMIGHSIGEYVAACLAGVMSLKDALTLVAMRGRLMQQLPSGSMLSIPLPEAEVKPLLNENLSLAASNAPSSCVVSGTHAAIDELSEQLLAQGIECRRLHTSHAFHSQMMEPILQTFIAEVKKITLNSPQIPFISNLTGTWISAQEATDANYWASHLRQTVRFADGISVLLQEANRILLEVGAGRTLSTFVKQQAGITQQPILPSLPHPKEEPADVLFLLNTLGRLWSLGVSVNWSNFYASERRYRIPLPTYPFERQSYWIEPQRKSSHSPTTNQKKPNIGDWFYIPVWKQAIPLWGRFANAPQPEKCKKQVLLFADNCQVGTQIVKRLESEGNNVVTVWQGGQFNKLNDSEYTINSSQPDDYDSLIEELQFFGQIPDTILHLWSITPTEQTTSGIEYFENCQNAGFYSLLFLAQSLSKQNITQPVDILVVTNDIYDVTGLEKLTPEKATVLGMCKTIPQEYANISCRSIDIVIPAAGTVAENQLLNQLLEELNTREFESLIAYRGHHRWVQTYEPLQLDNDQPPKLRQQGVYLITGGLGGIGLEIAEYLSKTVHAKLILVISSNFPHQNEWEEWLENHDGQDKFSIKIRKLQELEQLGAEILTLSADVANAAQMQTVITQAINHFGQINGVIHAAGIKLFRTVQEITRSECEQQLKANGHGLLILETALQGIELDFCILVSSLSSVLGALGMAAYPAAHHFTDAFVYKHNQTGSTPWLSVNWDNWLTSQLVTELANKPEISTELFIKNQEGVEVFQRVLSLNKVNQIVVSTTDLQARIEQWIKPSEIINQPNLLTLHARPHLQNNYVAPRNEIEQTIANIWQEILGIEQVGIEDNFLELGGDSLLSIQITARANKAGLRFTNQHLFEYPTIAQLAEIAGRTQTVLSEQGIVEGELPLTPIQHWFFEQNLVDAHHWNQTVILEVQQFLDSELLQQAVQYLLIHHDALRLRFIKEASGWQQINASPDEVVPFKKIDLSGLSPQQQEQTFEASIQEIQNSLNLACGPLKRVAFFDFGTHQPSRILFAVHHLAIDVGSWRILLEDLETAYQQLSQGKVIKLQPKTTSFKQWAARLTEYAQSIELQREQVYWLAAERDWVTPLPVDYPEGANTVASAETISVTLSVEETQALQEEIAATYRVQTDDILLAALAKAFSTWTSKQSLLVDLEGNGRDVIFDDVDLSRTIGWFTNIAPMLLDIGESEETGKILKQVKEQLRSFPNQGLGYGVLRYLSGDEIITEKLRSLQPAEVLFLYLGNFEQTLPESSLLKAPKSSGLSRSSRAQRSHLIEINAFIVQNQLKIDWIYSTNVYRQETIARLAEDFKTALQALITNIQSSSSKNFTPSDFAEFKLSQWNQDDIDNILAAINQVINYQTL